MQETVHVERASQPKKPDVYPVPSGVRGDFELKDNADFISTARTDVPALVAAVRELTVTLAEFISAKIDQDMIDLLSSCVKERP